MRALAEVDEVFALGFATVIVVVAMEVVR